MWLEHDPKKTPPFRNNSWLLKVFWNQDLNFVSLTYLSKIPGTGASENICTVIRTLGKPCILIFVSEYYQNRWTSPYWYSTWIETIPKQLIYFGIWGNFFSCWKYCSKWLDEWNYFFSSHLKSLLGNVYTYESSFSDPNQGLSVALLKLLRQKPVLLLEKKVQCIWSISFNWELFSSRVQTAKGMKSWFIYADILISALSFHAGYVPCLFSYQQGFKVCPMRCWWIEKSINTSEFWKEGNIHLPCLVEQWY